MRKVSEESGSWGKGVEGGRGQDGIAGARLVMQ